jgi:uncharacterized protein (TIGR02145 family)
MNGAASSDLNPSGVQGIAPTGWHVPSDAEWKQLSDYVGSVPEYILNNDSSYIAKALASQNYWNASTVDYAPGNDLTENNKTLFGIVPAGVLLLSSLRFAGSYSFCWSATLKYTDKAWNRSIQYNDAPLNVSSSGNNAGYSVRCVCDLSPTEFAAWYYNQYGSYNHQI